MNWISDRLIARIAFRVTLISASVCATHALAQPLHPTQWQSPHFADHPLAGTVWHGNAAHSDWHELSARIEQASYILVGEVHNNVDHHRLQANVLHRIADQRRSAHVVWEMIPEEKQSVLDAIDPANTEAARDLGKALNWAASGWPSWKMYEPIATAAVTHAMPMRGAALPRKFVRTLMKSDGKNLSPSQIKRLSLERKLSNVQSDSMLQQLYDGHCQLMDKAQLKPMIWIQRARDGAMARAMATRALATGQQPAAVLIAGNEHIRKDWGVPAVLSHVDPDASTLSIAQIEVSEGLNKPTDYHQLTLAPRIFDFVVFTPRAEIRDHCADLRKRWKRK